MKISNQTNGHEPEFQVEGGIVYLTEYRSPSGAERIKHSRRFVVARKGQQWKIRTTNLKEDDRFNSIEYDEIGCDGTTIHELQCFDGTHPSIAGVKDIISAQGRVRLGTTPAGFDLDFFLLLWIGYCSSQYFMSLKDNRITAPLFIMPNSLRMDVPPVLSLPAKWKLNESHFVNEIAWQSEGEALHVDNHGSRLEKYPPPFDAGFLQATFETTSWTSFSKIRLPGGFILKVFGPIWPQGKEPKCVQLYTIEAKVQAVRALHNFSFRPELPKKTTITDTRYRSVKGCSGPLNYAGLAWMTGEDVEAKYKSLGMEYEKQTSQG
jgi:hypothetical protein